MDKKKILKDLLLALLCTALVVALILVEGSFGGGGDSADTEETVKILYTGDIHCGVDKGFGLGGLKAVKDRYEEKGYETILVDVGDAIQGSALGMMTDGEAVIELMNLAGYDIAVPGNHEFDYTADRFLELAEEADFPYVCCNLTKNDELVFDPYIIKEAGGMKIAFVGVTTPQSITTSTPEYFEDESGNRVYGFMEGGDGQELYDAVQDAVDSARAEGADCVYLLAHLGINDAGSPWTCEDVVSHTNGIDVVLDGHSHDTEQMVMTNKDGEDVVRSASGTKLQAIGHSEVSDDEGATDTDIWSWGEDISIPDLLGLDNDVEKEVDAVMDELEKTLGEVIGTSEVDLTIYDPEEKDDKGEPVRIVRRSETNLGDFCADAARIQLGADIALVNGGAIRTNLEKGDVTYEDITDVYPFNNDMCTIEVTGQEILDALEWGAREAPDETGAFLQVSGLSYEVDTSKASTCKEDEDGYFAGVSGDRRVGNVTVGGEKLDASATYTVAGSNYLLQKHGDGYTMFDDASKVTSSGKLDSEVLIDYLQEALGGTIGEGYTDPYGDGRISVN